MTEFKLNNLFFALWPDQKVRAELLRLQSDISSQSGSMQHPDDLHMTLVFLGSITPEQITCARRVADSIEVDPFALELNLVGYWQRPRILWCRSDGTPDLLSQLVYDLQQGLRACGVQPEGRPYRPHITLVRKAVAVDERFLAEPFVWVPDKFVLAGSCAGHNRPRYRVLNQWDMGRS